MTFSVHSERSGLEYGGGGWQRIFAQRRNLVRPRFHRMLLEIRRFYREASELLEDDSLEPTLAEYVERKRFSKDFLDEHLIPFGAAIWSASTQDIREFPARFFVQFFANHGFLSLRKPEWRVIAGGSAQYLEPLTAPFAKRIRLRAPVQQIRRRPTVNGDAGGVDVALVGGGLETFDDVVLAVHTDQALVLLADPSRQECDILSSMAYQENHVVLHTDVSRLPRSRRAWSSWNYRVPVDEQDRVTVTYNMNMLQGLTSQQTYCVTLNDTDGIDPRRILREFVYHHPRYTRDFVAAQRRRSEIDGVRHTHYCGAGWGYGFHEDGVVSALQVARRFGEEL